MRRYETKGIGRIQSHDVKALTSKARLLPEEKDITHIFTSALYLRRILAFSCQVGQLLLHLP